MFETQTQLKCGLKTICSTKTILIFIEYDGWVPQQGLGSCFFLINTGEVSPLPLSHLSCSLGIYYVKLLRNNIQCESATHLEHVLDGGTQCLH